MILFAEGIGHMSFSVLSFLRNETYTSFFELALIAPLLKKKCWDLDDVDLEDIL